MKVMLVVVAYPPELRSASDLMKELAHTLRDRGFDVTVATCFPQYNLAEDVSVKDIREYSVEDGIKVIRIKTLPHHKVNFIVRGIAQLSLPFSFLRKVLKYVRANDVVVVYSPALTLWKVGQVVADRHGSRFILNVQDIFPQNAIDLGVLNNPLLIRLFEWIERRAYRRADQIVVHSESNRQFLIERKGLSPQKVHRIHNWVELAPPDPGAAQAGFRARHNLEGKFVFVFGGVIGPSQGLELLVEAARKIREHQDIVLVFIGDGTEKPRLVAMARSFGLTNILFLPFMDKKAYDAALAELDVGLVCLSSKNQTPVVPGKILGYMAASMPILALLNKESDGLGIIEEAGCGYGALSDDPGRAAELMLKMYREAALMPDLGQAGRRYAAEHFEREACVDQLTALFE